MGMPKNELIAKLEEISVRYKDTVVIQAEMDEFIPDDHYERKIRVPDFPEQAQGWEEAFDHENEDAVQTLEKAYAHAYCPKEPAKPNIGKRPEHEPNLANELKKKQGCLPSVAGFIAVCSLISGGLFSGEALTVIINLAILAACAVAILVFFLKYMRAKAADKEVTRISIEGYEHHKKEQEENYAREMEVYLTKRAAYLLSKGDFLEEYTAWREVYLDHLREEAEIEEKLEADRIAGVNRIYEEQYIPAQKKLEESNDLITEEYLPVLPIIIELIKSGRADGLKEAINLYEELVYRERQLQLQREQEEQRRYEEEQRRQDEERRYREEMKFREDQERQRRREEEQRRQDEDRRHREDMRAREAEARRHELQEKERLRRAQVDAEQRQREQQAAQRSAASAQCRACAHAGRCDMVIHNKTPNCTGFTPRR